MKKFEIKWFEDYHEIEWYAKDNNLNYRELGGYYAKNGPTYLVYFGVFWKKKYHQLTAKDVLDDLEKKVTSLADIGVIELKL